MTYRNCFHCGQPDHWAAACPQKSRAPAPLASPAREDQIPGTPPAPVASTRGDYAAWAAYARTLIAPGHCGDPADLYQSQFRIWSGRAPIHLCELRAIATAQLEDRPPNIRLCLDLPPRRMRIMPGMTEQARRWLTVAQVSQLFGVNPKTVTRWDNNGRFDRITVMRSPGGHRKFLESDILAYIAELTREARHP